MPTYQLYKLILSADELQLLADLIREEQHRIAAQRRRLNSPTAWRLGPSWQHDETALTVVLRQLEAQAANARRPGQRPVRHQCR